MRINIIFSTKNGELTLPFMLESLRKQTLSCDYWQVIAIDNNSSDQTAKILASFSNKIPITILFEEMPGKNRCLNKAINISDGDLILFTDDDIIAPQKWLENYRNTALDKTNHVFGAGVIPKWPIQPPKWILNAIPQQVAFVVTDKINEGKCDCMKFFGPNFAIRKTTIDSVGYFDENIGPTIGNYAMGSESSYLMRLKNLGYEGYFIENNDVQHIIRKNQMELNWLLGRALRYGKGQCQLEGNPNQKTLFGYPRWTIRKMLTNYLSAAIAINKERKAKLLWESYIHAGYAIQFKNLYSNK
jgi:glycosyltransferase involved in cell wall biosynthesis